MQPDDLPKTSFASKGYKEKQKEQAVRPDIVHRPFAF